MLLIYDLESKFQRPFYKPLNIKLRLAQQLLLPVVANTNHVLQAQERVV
jgi:hypothetical protein